MRVAGSKDCHTFSADPIILSTPERYDEGVTLLTGTAKQIAIGEKIETITGGVPGPLDPNHDGLVNAPNLPDWVGRQLKHDISEKLDAPVRLENDAVVVGVGEAVRGAGRGCRIVAYITISTGVGGARIVDGRPDHAYLGFEAGHQIVDLINGEPRTIESLISGTVLKEKYGLRASEIDDPKLWDEICNHLASALNNIVVLWSPECIVLGGGMAPHVPMDLVKDKLNKLVKIFPKTPELKLAELGDIGGLYGALELIQCTEEG